uniref:Uncharacterized protein n=1 Tax=Kalanchoe fedtschenkoi TaxID=63787 RepID=A0A7N0VJZ0_KALFE
MHSERKKENEDGMVTESKQSTADMTVFVSKPKRSAQKNLGIVFSCSFFILIMDGLHADGSKQSTVDMTVFVQNLLQQMQNQFMSESKS